MITLAHLRQGDEILVRAIVDRVVGDSSAAVHVGNMLALIAAPDVAGRAAETLMWCGRTWTVLGRDGGEVWMRCGGIRVAVPESWITAGQVEVMS